MKIVAFAGKLSFLSFMSQLCVCVFVRERCCCTFINVTSMCVCVFVHYLIKFILYNLLGTGKTTTLVRYTQLRPSLKFLLIVYSKYVSTEYLHTFHFIN